MLAEFSLLYKLIIKGTAFRRCNLKETDFTVINLTCSILDNCDIAGVIIHQYILEKADYRAFRNFSIDPELNGI